MSKEYKVNADFLVNVEVIVDAESEEEARYKAKLDILSKNCDFLDPVEDPKIKWVEIEDDDDDYQCYYCGQDSCDCDML
jgi:hypothetical protein